MICEKCKDKHTIAYGRVDPFTGRTKITSEWPCPDCTKPCTDCNGRGHDWVYKQYYPCTTCGGTGVIPQGEDVPPIPNAALSSAQQQR